MNDDTLNFLYCFDSNYHNQAFTSIHSLLENVSKKINIFVIHNREFSVTELPDSIANHNNLKILNLINLLIKSILFLI